MDPKNLIYILIVVGIPLWVMVKAHKERWQRWKRKEIPFTHGGQEPKLTDHLGVGYFTFVVLVIAMAVLHKVFGFDF